MLVFQCCIGKALMLSMDSSSTFQFEFLIHYIHAIPLSKSLICINKLISCHHHLHFFYIKGYQHVQELLTVILLLYDPCLTPPHYNFIRKNTTTFNSLRHKQQQTPDIRVSAVFVRAVSIQAKSSQHQCGTSEMHIVTMSGRFSCSLTVHELFIFCVVYIICVCGKVKKMWVVMV